MSVDVLGGGPGGLYVARLLKHHHPHARVRVHEQIDPADTFGFGVGLAVPTQRRLNDADAESFAAIVAASHRDSGATMSNGQECATLPAVDGLAIARSRLLQRLRDLASAAGVELVYGQRRSYDELDAQIVIAADGVGSATRTALTEELGEHIDVGAGMFLWCGTDFALPHTIFQPRTSSHGVFVAHAYPYAADRSTFLIETDVKTYRAAGFDVTTDATPEVESDETALRYLEKVFAEDLDGHSLMGNRTRWTQFRTVRCDRWSHSNVVLLGDAVHTAHYSIGSGTKLAMEDAIALVEAIDEADDMAAAFALYAERRRPVVRSLQRAAQRSQDWWDSFPERLHLPVDTLLMSYLTRTGRVSLERVERDAPDLATKVLERHDASSTPTDLALARPLEFRRHTFESRLIDRRDLDGLRVTDVEFGEDSAWCDGADRLLHDLVPQDLNLGVLWVSGPADRISVLHRLDFAERLRMTYPHALVVTDGPPGLVGDLASGVASERTHLVAIKPTSKRIRRAPATAAAG